MKLKSRTKTRRFKLENALLYPNLSRWAGEVIDSIEKNELLVYDPKDKDAFYNEYDKNGAELILSRAKTPISIRDWLCIGCQYIRYKDRHADGKPSENEAACYQHNGANVLWPEYAAWEPEGPAAFVGEILIAPRTLEEINLHDDIITEHKFKCIISHELVHVFDMMRFVVPAFMDCPNFWKCVLGEGSACAILQSQYNDVRGFVDCYGEINELTMIEEYWPSQANAWFDAFRQGAQPGKSRGRSGGRKRHSQTKKKEKF